MDVAKYRAGEAARSVLADLLEEGIAKIVRQDAGEPCGRVGSYEPGNHGERRAVGRHAIDDRLVGKGHQEGGRLAG